MCMIRRGLCICVGGYGRDEERYVDGYQIARVGK